MCILNPAVLPDAAGEASTLTETEIVAQAITELQQICAPANIQIQEEAACTPMVRPGFLPVAHSRSRTNMKSWSSISSLEKILQCIY